MTRLERTLISRMEKAIFDFRMISRGDRILIGVSGGPDSLSLAKLFQDRWLRPNPEISLLALHVDLGFEEPEPRNSQQLESFFKSLAMDFRIIHTKISQKSLAKDAKKNPCFICSIYRRREMYEAAHREGCNKIAYGHHKDDIVETLLINIIYGRKISVMYPVQDIFQGTKQIIRPFAYIEEALIKRFARESGLPDLKRFCPEDGFSRRQRIKEIIKEIQKEEKYANIRENIFKSLYHVDIKFAPENQPVKDPDKSLKKDNGIETNTGEFDVSTRKA